MTEEKYLMISLWLRFAAIIELIFKRDYRNGMGKMKNAVWPRFPLSCFFIMIRIVRLLTANFSQSNAVWVWIVHFPFKIIFKNTRKVILPRHNFFLHYFDITLVLIHIAIVKSYHSSIRIKLTLSFA